MKTLICDLNVYENGHHLSFVKSILANAPNKDNLVFLFNKNASLYDSGLHARNHVFYAEEDFLESTRRSNLLIAKFREYRFISNFALQNNIEKIIFLDIDQYQVAIGLSRPRFIITGIYFRSFHLVRILSGSWQRNFKNIIYRLKKRIMFGILRSNKKVGPIFILNDKKAAEKYPAYFKYLPDPIFVNTINTDNISIRSEFEIPDSAHVFLVFGAIGARKNIRNIVGAFSAAVLTKEAVLLIAGKVRSDFKDEFYNIISQFKNSNTNPLKKIFIRDQFVDDNMMDAYFKCADTVVICYQKFYGSSGLMGIASVHKKSCIVPTEGLLFELCNTYDLGFAADPFSIPSIATALADAANNITTPSGHQKFVEDHHEKVFVNTLLNN